MSLPLTPEALVFGMTVPSDPRLAPDGGTIVYSLTITDAEEKRAATHLWACALDGSANRQLTQTGTRNRDASWSPDGIRIAFVSDRMGRDGIFVLPLQRGGEANQVIQERREISELAWSPSGERFAYTMQIDPENPDELDRPAGSLPPVLSTRRLDYKSDGRGYLGDRRSQIFVVNCDGTGRRQLTDDAVGHNRPSWSPDGSWLAFQAAVAESQATRLAVVHLHSGERRVIGAEEGVVSLWSWSPDGNRILFAGDTAASSGQYDFFMYELSSGETRQVTRDLECQPDEGRLGQAPPAQLVWLDDCRVLFNAFRAGGTELDILDTESGRVECIAYSKSLNAGLSVDNAHRFAVQTQVSLEGPNELRVFDLQQRSTRLISSYSEPLLARHPTALFEQFQVSRNGFTIDAWLLKPRDFDAARKYPVILDVHGGPQGFYGYDFDPVQQLLATQGFLVVFCNPRGSTTYGREFTRQVWRDWGGEDFLDLMAVVDHVIERPYVDAGRQGIYGSSYGGYMTAWAITQTNRFRAAVSRAPIFNLESFHGTSDIGYTWSKTQFGGSPYEASEFYAARSPSTFAHRVTTPTLILHGEDDHRCPIGEGEQMFVALRKAGCETEFVRYPLSSHLFFRSSGPPEYRLDFLGRVLAWFKSHLGEVA